MGLFTGKTVIVTGGGKATLKDGSAGSIGYGIDIAFAKEGANLVITGRNVASSRLPRSPSRPSTASRFCLFVDVSAGQDNEAVVQNVIDKAIEEFGHIDAVVNNAQASASGVTIADHTMDQFNLAIYSGLYATYLYMQKAYPHLKETKGSVVNFASGAGLFGNYGQCSYAAAKEGIRGLTRVAANGGARTASTSTSCARLLGPLRSRTSRMPIPRRSRPTSTCRRQADYGDVGGNRPRGRSALRPRL